MCLVMVLQRSVCIFIAVALMGQSLIVHEATKQCTTIWRIMDHNGICFIPIFNFPDVETVASHSPGRVCLSLSPPGSYNRKHKMMMMQPSVTESV